MEICVGLLACSCRFKCPIASIATLNYSMFSLNLYTCNKVNISYTIGVTLTVVVQCFRLAATHTLAGLTTGSSSLPAYGRLPNISSVCKSNKLIIVIILVLLLNLIVLIIIVTVIMTITTLTIIIIIITRIITLIMIHLGITVSSHKFSLQNKQIAGLKSQNHCLRSLQHAL